MNKVIISGNLVGDWKKLRDRNGDLIRTVNGHDIFVNEIAYNDYERSDKAVYYFNLKAYGEYGKHIARTSRKGSSVLISGKLEQIRKDGQYYHCIVVQEYENNRFAKDNPNYNNEDRYHSEDRYSNRNYENTRYDDRDRYDDRYNDRNRYDDRDDNRSYDDRNSINNNRRYNDDKNNVRDKYSDRSNSRKDYSDF